jgi:hypothetical protein
MEEILRAIVSNPTLHRRWLETLSHLENCGARKIHSIQPSGQVPLSLLQHAAEEARHALQFKLFSRNLLEAPAPYPKLLGLPYGHRYLTVLDLRVSRTVRTHLDVNQRDFHRACYLLTTYVIEKRAERLYPLYEQILREAESNFSLNEIIREETQHLKLILRQIDSFPGLSALLPELVSYEETLYSRWIDRLQKDIAHVSH